MNTREQAKPAELSACRSAVRAKARGCDLAFDLFVETEIRSELPSGSADRAMVRVSSVMAFLVMKGMALHDG